MSRIYVGGPQHGQREKGALKSGYAPHLVITEAVEQGQIEVLLHETVPVDEIVPTLYDADKTLKPEPPQAKLD